MTEIADLYVRLTANTAGFKAAMAGAAAEGESAAVRMQRGMKGVAAVGVVAAAGIALIGARSIDMASKFQSSMELIRTQAGASQAEVNAMSGAVLNMAQNIGVGPQKLADALYHVESAGFKGKVALDMVRESAKGSKIGMADMEAVTQAMIGTMAVGFKDVHGAADAMAYLNKIVGMGDMRMGKLAQSIATGVLPTFKSAGLGMKDFGAALATLTDNVTPADEAATRLRMTVALMSAPSGAAIKALQHLGIGATQLAQDFRKGGLLTAVQDLRRHMLSIYPASLGVKMALQDQRTAVNQFAADLTASGIPLSKQKPALADYAKSLAKTGTAAMLAHQYITKAFGGGRSSGAIMTMIEESDRLASKYGGLGTAASRAADFQAAWQATQDTFRGKMESLRSTVDVLMTKLGLKLLPIMGKVADTFMKSIGWLQKHQEVVRTLAAAVGGVLVTGLTLAAVAFAEFAGPTILIGSAIGAVAAGMYRLYEHSKPLRGAISEIAGTFTHVVHVISDGIALFKMGFSDWGKVITGHQSAWLEWGQKIRVVVDNVRSFLGAFGRAVVTTAQFLTHLWQTSSRFRGIIMAVGTAIALTVAPFLTLGAALVYVNQRWHIVGQVMTWFVHGPLAFVKQQIAVFQQFWAAHGQAILTIIRVVWTLISTYIKIEWAIISSILKVGLVTVQTMWKYSWDLIVNVVKLVWNTISAYIRTVIHVVLDSIGLFADLLTGKWGKLWGDVKKLVSDAFTGILGTVKAFAGGCLTLLYTAGKDLIQGLINGVKAMGGAAVDAVKGIGHSIVSGFTSLVGIKSPSTVFHGYGVNIGQGLVNGMASMHGHVANAGKAMASKAAHHAHAQITKAAAAAKHAATRAAVAAHKGIDQSISGVTTANTADRHRNAILSAFITDRRHHTKAGQAYARTLLGHDLAKDRAADVHARAVSAAVSRNPHATAAERKRAGNAVTQADKILATAEKLRASIEKMTSSTSSAAKQSMVLNGRLITSHGRRLGARQAVLEDMPTYLAAMVHAGRAGTVTRRPYEGQPWRAPVTAGAMHFTVPVTVHVGTKKVHEEMQRHTIRHEGRNVNNGLSRHTSR